MRGFDPYLTLQKLEVFCTVAELGSVTRAADRLCIAQPVVTAHLRGLESKLGYALVHKVGRNIALTEAGERVYRWAGEMLSRTREMERELAGLQQGAVGKAVVAASMSVGSYALPALITDFYQQHQDGLVSVQISNPVAAVDATRTGGCDFAVVMLAPSQNLEGLTVQPLWEEPLLLVAAPESRWVSSPAAEIDLNQVPFVSAPPNLARREIEDAQLRRYGLSERRIVLEFGHPEAMKHAVAQDLGLCFMLASSIRDDLERGDLQVLDRPDLPLAITTSLVHRDQKSFSPFQAALIQHIRQAATPGTTWYQKFISNKL